MNAKQLAEVGQRLELLDERLTYKIRPRRQVSMSPASTQQLEERLKDLAEFSIELKELLQDLVRALGDEPGGSPPA